MVATAAADPGEAEGVDVARKEHIDVVAKVFAGEVVNRRGAGARTPISEGASNGVGSKGDMKPKNGFGGF